MGVGGSQSMTNGPCASVIGPVRNRRAMLAELLEALAAQTYRDFEVIVVDDGSDDGSGEEAQATRGIDVRVVRTPGVGAVGARERGVAVARGDFLAFTDSDCVPAADWLERAIAAFTDGIDLVQGRTEPVRGMKPLERSVWVDREDGLYATCNVLYRRKAFEQAGGFQHAGELLGFRPGAFSQGLGFGEDAILGWKVRDGGRAVFVPEAIVRHQVVRPTVSEALRRAWMAGAFPSLVREIPELRDTLLRHRFFLGTRRVPMYAAVLALLLRLPRLSLLAAAVWAALRARDVARAERSPAKVAEAIGLEMAGDVVSGAALVAGSARARKLVL